MSACLLGLPRFSAAFAELLQSRRDGRFGTTSCEPRECSVGLMMPYLHSCRSNALDGLTHDHSSIGVLSYRLSSLLAWDHARRCIPSSSTNEQGTLSPASILSL